MVSAVSFTKKYSCTALLLDEVLPSFVPPPHAASAQSEVTQVSAINKDFTSLFIIAFSFYKFAIASVRKPECSVIRFFSIPSIAISPKILFVNSVLRVDEIWFLCKAKMI